jgi:nicotinamide-nucleotide amidase
VATPLAAILTIGDELLQGDRTDTNARWLAEALTGAGFRVTTLLSSGDAEGAIGGALARAESDVGAGVVLVTGGLGPTLDDRTREAVALHRGVPLVLHPPTLARLESWFAQRGERELPPTNHRIAQVPRGGRVHPNPVGTAPGLELPPAPGFPSTLFLLPGVPGEMQALFREAVRPRLDEAFPRREASDAVRVVRTSGVAESRLASMLEPRLAALPGGDSVNLQYRPSVQGVELRFSASGEGAEEKVSAILDGVGDLLAPVAWGGGADALEGVVVEAMVARGWRMGVGESCTGGLLAARITGVPGSSRVLEGGVVAYANAVKEAALGVDPRALASHGAVSAPVARAMARGARALVPGSGGRVGVGITGVAGPGGGSPEKPVGTVWIGWAGPDDEVADARVFRFPGSRDDVRERAVQQALLGLFRRTRGQDPVPSWDGVGASAGGDAG